MSVRLVIPITARATEVSEAVANGTAVGITAFAEDADGERQRQLQPVSDDAGGAFAIDSSQR